LIFIEIDPNNEQEPTHLSVGIAFENLSKQFGENKKAVENLSLKLYENQITALLGHNGAGKVTKQNSFFLSVFSFSFFIDNNN
jgi:ABC-type bacteriocin/lantibiotic exporter with double-glycine peptidase domain